MKLALILPANIMHAPYINYYIKVLNENNIRYEIINWNKLGVDEDVIGHTFNYTSSYKTNLLNKILSYYLFSKFVKKTLRREEYDKLIVFVPQIALFLLSLLKKKYKKKYILDIRDFAKANKYMKKLEVIIENSNFTVISSEGYKKWLPSQYNYVISHNTMIESRNLSQAPDFKNKNEIIISNIGVIRNFYENSKVINAFRQSKKYELRYIGKGVSEKDLEEYCKDNDISNVYFHGRYEKQEELGFYHESDIINLVMPNNGLGYRTLMANRFYNACISLRPMIVSKGSFMGEIVEKYRLGMVVDLERDNLLEIVDNYIINFDSEKFLIGCNNFLSDIQKDQDLFVSKITEFINDNTIKSS